MPLALLGLALIGLGIACGAALVAASMGLAAVAAGATLWVLFPLFIVGGFVLLATGGSLETVRRVSLAGSLALLALALASALALVASAMGLVPRAAASSALWYVLFVAGAIGSVGSAAFRPKSDAPRSGA